MHRFLPFAFVFLSASVACAADARVGLRPAHGVALDNHVESIAPPFIQCGKTSRLTFTGRDLGVALDLWHSLPAGAIKALPIESKSDRIVMDIAVAVDAPVGVCGVRIATKDGLTNACLLMVEDLTTSVWGTFREGTVDRYRVEVKAGERVSFEVVSNQLGKNADPVLVIRDDSGKSIAERDNDPGLYFDLRFEHQFEAAGTYSVEVRDARFRASEHNHYVLRMGRFPAGRVVVPSAIESGFTGEVRLPEVPGREFALAVPRTQWGPFFANVKRPDDRGSTWVPLAPSLGPVTVAEEFDEARDNALSQAASGPAAYAFTMTPGLRNPFLSLDRHFTLGRLQATSATIPGTLCGVLQKPGRSDAFKLRLNKGERIFVRGEAKALNSPVDLELVIVDKSGREQRRAGENAQTREEASFDFTAPNAGDYALLVRDAIRDGSDASAYRVTVRSTPFPPSLMAEVEGLTIPQGTYQPIPITATRNGSAGPIKLHLIGPPGLKLTPDEIGEKETAIVCRLEASESVPLGVHTVQIVAESADERTLVYTRPLIDMKWQNVDLIPLALREDQMRLPPGLADRFAVQIAPPSPFTFELAEKVISLPRYRQAAIPIVTTRAAGFEGSIAFEARGGQLAEESEGRTRVFARFREATPKRVNVSGVVVSKILSNTVKSRIEVTATARHQGQRIQLLRTFDLDLTTAFKFAPEPVKVSLLPGESTRARVSISKVKGFDGPVILHLQPMPGITFPETVMVPKGQTSVEIDIAVSLDAQPRKQGLAVMAAGEVDGFEEEVRGSPIEIEVRKVEPPKKK